MELAFHRAAVQGWVLDVAQGMSTSILLGKWRVWLLHQQQLPRCRRAGGGLPPVQTQISPKARPAFIRAAQHRPGAGSSLRRPDPDDLPVTTRNRNSHSMFAASCRARRRRVPAPAQEPCREAGLDWGGVLRDSRARWELAVRHARRLHASWSVHVNAAIVHTRQAVQGPASRGQPTGAVPGLAWASLSKKALQPGPEAGPPSQPADHSDPILISEVRTLD